MIDTEAIQHEVQQAFQKMERSQRSRWGSSEPLVSELLDRYEDKTLELLKAGEFDDALELLIAFLEPFLEQWMDFVEQDECDFNTFAHNLASHLLGATLTPVQRTSGLKQIPSLQEILRNADADLATLAQEDRHTTRLRLDHLEGLERFEEALIRTDPSSVYGEARSGLVARVAQTDKACALRLGVLLLHAPDDDEDAHSLPELARRAAGRALAAAQPRFVHSGRHGGDSPGARALGRCLACRAALP